MSFGDLAWIHAAGVAIIAGVVIVALVAFLDWYFRRK